MLRGLSSRSAHRVTVTVTGGDGWVEARYKGEPKQEGLISRLLEGERSVSIGRFRHPGIAELEYLGQGRHRRSPRPSICARRRADTVHGFGMLTGPRQGGLGHLKALLFRPFFRSRSSRIGASCRRRRRTGGCSRERRQMIGPLDVMRPHIDAILAGRRPDVAEKPAEIVMEL